MVSGKLPVQAVKVGDVAQLGEHLLCKQGVVGSSPIVSTSNPRSQPPVMFEVSTGLWVPETDSFSSWAPLTSVGLRHPIPGLSGAIAPGVDDDVREHGGTLTN